MTLPTELRLAVADARDRLGAFAELRYVQTIGSTNDAASELASAGAAEGVAVLSDEQTSGRGRRGRSWSSPPGAGLYLSVILRGPELTTLPGLVTLGAGVAAADAVHIATGLPVMLKWPNDLVMGDSWKKLGGILCEAQGPDALVVGIGINLTSASHPPDVSMRATDVETELGRAIDRTAVVVECLAQLKRLSESLRATGQTDVLTQWRARAATGWQSAIVSWQDGGRPARGIARDVDVDGALLVERDGHHERVIAGEVLWDRRP